MPNIKISQLPAATSPLAGTEPVPIVQGGQTRQATITQVVAAAPTFEPQLDLGTLSGSATLTARAPPGSRAARGR